MEKRTVLILINMISEIGPIRLRRIYNHFARIEDIFTASEQALCSIEDIGPTLAKKILKAKETLPWQKELDLIKQKNVNILTNEDSTYPALLKTIPDAPLLLYTQGKFNPEVDNFAVAIVGTRRPSAYGRMVTEKITESLVKLNLTVISGLARGVDTIVHQTALKYKGRTIAVLGNGLNIVYPPENRKLQCAIPENDGVVVTEFPMTFPPDRTNFPRRNRIIAGLTLGTIVTEADLKSGALITAKLALEQGKEVFAVPGNIFSLYSRGPHYLIKQGAKLLETVDDVLDEIVSLKERINLIKPVRKEQVELPLLTEDEKNFFRFIPVEPVNIDLLILQSKNPVGKISQLLMSLEMKGMIKSLPGKMYQRCILTEKDV